MGRFLGGRFGNTIPISPGTAAPSGIYTSEDQYYALQEGGWTTPTGIDATGGVISDYVVGSDVYRAHVFTSTGELTVNSLATNAPDNNAEYLVVAGGGGGGGDSQSGGGGGGGFRTNLSGHPVEAAAYTLEVGTYTVTIGAGGVGGAGAAPLRAGNGGNSELYLNGTSYPDVKRVRSVGGGGSLGYEGGPPKDGSPGGSGGGGFNRSGTSNGGTGNTPTDPNHPQVQGYGGGDSPTYGAPYTGGGGGGAGRVGAPDNPSTPLTRSTGGYGLQALIAGPPLQPQPIGAPGPGSGAAGTGYFAGGGGGGGYNSTGADGGYGGGGPGNTGTSGVGISGTVSTGGGGGGAGGPAGGPGGNGGSGVVVVKYKIASIQTGTAKATGGNISYYGGKVIHTFVSSGEFINASPISDVEVVMIAGGGAGGTNIGSGGGAGGFLQGTGFTFPNNTYTITVGSGGAGRTSRGPVAPTDASNTTISYTSGTWTAPRGGYGSSYPGIGAQPGGSGGGGGSDTATGGSTNASPSTTPIGTLTAYGNAGGTSTGSYQGSGGGGAGAGGSAGSTGTGGAGGDGRQLPSTFHDPRQSPSDVSNPTPYQRGGGLGTPGPSGGFWFAGGGGGSSYPTGAAPGGAGGAGGGGAGGTDSNNPTPSDGVSAVQNTGSGGGGSGYSPTTQTTSGNGGSGIVLIAYPTS